MNCKPILFLIAVTCCFFSCQEKKKANLNGNAFFGGEIVNPNSPYVVILKNNTVVDSLYLDKDNRFSYTFKDFEPGLFHFYDGREVQSVLIQPNDSLMFRLNTMDFDESLVFTGIGEKENNFLIDLFLLNDKLQDSVLKISQLEPDEFEEQLNQIKQIKQDKLDAFKSKYQTTALFDKLAQAKINYNYYYSKEAYPFINYRENERQIFDELSDDFYSYRDNVNYNDNDLKEYRPYVSFLRVHFNNIALQQHFEHSKDSEYNNQNIDYNIDKLNLIDQKVSDTFTKNKLLYYNMVKFINGSQNDEDFDKLLNLFKQKSTNQDHINKAETLVNTYKRLKPGKTLPEVTVIDKNDNFVLLNKLIKDKSVIYFWDTSKRSHLRDVHLKANDLKSKYPEIEFIAINVNDISTREQFDILQRNGLKHTNEYHFKKPNEALDLLAIRPINKVFLVDKNGVIINPKGNLFDIKFENELLGLINQ
ncbi:hypothetical protein C7H62_2070 [Mesoflavibacter sp. HG96]|uniref:TlpA family protein disulfide reductase n=1 Tax=unclassified Mesoflavibacter TaxID=2630131 RepID=UPI000D0F5C3E|nr:MULTISPECIES: hypothetical protein [unclassified Mesoflavibacter]QIJ89878.1 hypothetical protein C7H62_2070 [Mesoflavibacter sp. HG96]QIJ92606.1 hypothetical protein C7H56_2070 [Mesoflavibacter sp. HG37]